MITNELIKKKEKYIYTIKCHTRMKFSMEKDKTFINIFENIFHAYFTDRYKMWIHRFYFVFPILMLRKFSITKTTFME